jgi:putative Mg2+ transporter-C (MgtC) family protein
MTPEIDLQLALIWYHLYQIGIAFLLALPIAINREHRSEGAGLRTFPLVAIATCAFMLVGIDVYSGPEAEARVMYGIISGMGFIGGGSIIKQHGRTGGTATAAGIWLTGAVGLAVAYQRYEIAIVLSFIGFVIFQFSSLLKKPVIGNTQESRQIRE